MIGICIHENTVLKPAIMPETLNAHWRNILGENYTQLHAEYLHTIGNLAPMNQSDNSTNSNDPFEKKRPQFEQSSWKLTRDVSDNYDNWDIETIKDRSKKLAELASKIWQSPMPRDRQLEASKKRTSQRTIDDYIRACVFRLNRADKYGNTINASMVVRKWLNGKDAYIVTPGSIISPVVNSKNDYFMNYLNTVREKVSDCLAEKDGKLYTIKDISFDSPSLAAGFCTGHSENGWEVWMEETTGNSLDSLAKAPKIDKICDEIEDDTIFIENDNGLEES